MSRKAEELNIRNLKKLIDAGHSQQHVVETAIANHWQGLYAPKGGNKDGWNELSTAEEIDAHLQRKHGKAE